MPEMITDAQLFAVDFIWTALGIHDDPTKLTKWQASEIISENEDLYEELKEEHRRQMYGDTW